MGTKFHKLYTITAEGMKILKEPGVKRKVFRALDGAIDSYEDQRIDKEDEIAKLTEKLATGDTSVIPALVEAHMALDEIEAQAKKAAFIRDDLDAEAKEDK